MTKVTVKTPSGSSIEIAGERLKIWVTDREGGQRTRVDLAANAVVFTETLLDDGLYEFKIEIPGRTS